MMVLPSSPFYIVLVPNGLQEEFSLDRKVFVPHCLATQEQRWGSGRPC